MSIVGLGKNTPISIDLYHGQVIHEPSAIAIVTDSNDGGFGSMRAYPGAAFPVNIFPNSEIGRPKCNRPEDACLEFGSLPGE
jgi:hypothetical protein